MLNLNWVARLTFSFLLSLQGQASQSLSPEKSRPSVRSSSSSEKVLEHSLAACGSPLNLQNRIIPSPKGSGASDEVTPPRSYGRGSHQAGGTPAALPGKLSMTSLNGYALSTSGSGGGGISAQANGGGSPLHRSDSHVSRFQVPRCSSTTHWLAIICNTNIISPVLTYKEF